MSGPLRAFVCAALTASILGAAPAPSVGAASKTASTPQTAVDQAFCRSTLAKVDEIVQKNFWKADSVPAWNEAVKRLRSKIEQSKTIVELDDNINEALHSLRASHTQFVTPNDETYYFLESLFRRRGSKDKTAPQMDFVGAVTGGVECARNEVRYVLDGSPAQSAGIKMGDQLITVNGAPYVGQLSWRGTAGKAISVTLKRPGVATPVTLNVKPLIANDLDRYLKAIQKSVSVTESGGKRIGYIHVWCGGSEAHDILEDELGAKKLQLTDGLIFDLRDGYGGNYYNDLDYFYRPAKGYPPFFMMGRKGKHDEFRMYYDKPVVALINGGARSGKELLAYSLKNTGRATLVGEKTAGAVLGGRLFDINSRGALYLAVEGPQPDSLSLEGVGVSPDIEVKACSAQRGLLDLQRDTAKRILLEKLKR